MRWCWYKVLAAAWLTVVGLTLLGLMLAAFVSMMMDPVFRSFIITTFGLFFLLLSVIASVSAISGDFDRKDE